MDHYRTQYPVPAAADINDWPVLAFSLWFRVALVGVWLAVAGLAVLITGDQAGMGVLLLLSGAALGTWGWQHARHLLDHLDAGTEQEAPRAPPARTPAVAFGRLR